VRIRHQLGPGCSAAKPAAASSQRRQAHNNDSAKVNRMVNSATRYIKVIEANAAQAVQAAMENTKTARALPGVRRFDANSYFLY
jgi:hypothetical protein